MRPGRAADLLSMTRLLEHEVRAGLRDAVPPKGSMRRVLAGFDWEACSRVAESDGGVAGMVLVLRSGSGGTTVTRVEAAVGPDADPTLLESLTRWGVGLSRAAGSRVAQVWRAQGTGAWLRDLGLEPVRPWLRMDRGLESGLPPVVGVDGYHLLDPTAVSRGVWVDVFNRAFADHWRHSPRSENEMRPASTELSLLAADSAGTPAAMALSEIETYTADRRPQPVGIVGSVGTVPAHRRRGLARWLVAESLQRLQAAGAATASLYVDGRNENRAPDLYKELGFGVTFDTTVWEATFP